MLDAWSLSTVFPTWEGPFCTEKKKNSEKYSGLFHLFQSNRKFCKYSKFNALNLYVVQMFMQIAFTKNKICLPTYIWRNLPQLKKTQVIFKLHIDMDSHKL